MSAECSDLQPEREAVQYACHTGLCVCCYVIVCESMTVEAPGKVSCISTSSKLVVYINLVLLT